MYEKLVKSLRWLGFMFPETHPARDNADRISNNIHLYCTQAADAIEELCDLCASQSKDCSEAVAKYLDLWAKQPRWIPVTERLPEDYEKVLTCDDRGNIHMFEHCYSYKYPFNIGPNHPRFYPVLFWMPLPEPPKEAEET